MVDCSTSQLDRCETEGAANENYTACFCYGSGEFEVECTVPLQRSADAPGAGSSGGSACDVLCIVLIVVGVLVCAGLVMLAVLLLFRKKSSKENVDDKFSKEMNE